MKEIVPGVFHWTRVHPHIRKPVSSYWLVTAKVVIDPLAPEEGLEAFDRAPPLHVYLTNRHHYRDSGAFIERFGCSVWCSNPGMDEFTAEQKVRPFAFGDELPGGVRTFEIGAICPDETALLVPAHHAVAVADGVTREGDGPLGFVPDFLLGDDPDAVKKGLRAAYGRLCDAHDFDNLLLAHGDPWIGGAKAALLEFVRG